MGFVIFNKHDVVGEFAYDVKGDFFTFTLDKKYEVKLKSLPQEPVSEEDTIIDKVEISNFIRATVREKDIHLLELLLRQFNRSYYHYWVSSKQEPVNDYFWVGQYGDKYEEKVEEISYSA